MLNRLTISTLLKAAIALCGIAVLALLSFSVSDSWGRMRAASKAAAATEASSYLFTALTNIRYDRANAFRALKVDNLAPDIIPLMRKAQAAEMPALKSAVTLLQELDFPGQGNSVTELAQQVTKLDELHRAIDAALAQPMATRPAALPDQAFKQLGDLLDLIDSISKNVAIAIKLQDSYIDQLLQIKDLAWAARNAGGDASVVISSTMAGKPLSPTAWDDYVGLVSKINTSWAQLKEVSKGLPLPARYQEAVQKVEREFFDAAYIGKRTDALKALIAGKPPAITLNEWTPLTVGKLVTVENVAEVALDAAKERTAAQYAAARSDLIFQLVLMAVAVVFVAGMLILVSLRVISPLHKLTGAMRKLADGDFGVVLPGLGRKDEIGAIAAAVEGFKIKAAEKAQRDAAAQSAQERQMATERDAAMTRLSGEFEAAVGGIVQAAVRGDFSQRVAIEGKTGLILNVGTAINSLCENISGALDDLAAMLGSLADGDLTRRITRDYEGTFATLKEGANTTAERVGAAISEIKRAGQEVASAASEISASTTDLSQRTEEQAASLEQTSASMEEMSVTVKKNADQAKLANQYASETRETADRSGQVVAEAVHAMSRIDESSKKIADIITVIDEIARQTNLLALNAAVEAARAGEAGRGFAVVASEVRSLAQRSSQAAKDIKDLITSSSTQVQEGVDLVNKAGGSLSGIVESIKKVAAIVSDISTASIEQSTGIDQVNKALGQVDEVTQQNSALVEENAATAKALEHQAATMNERMGAFRLNDAPAAARMAKPAAGPISAPPAERAKPKPAAAKPVTAKPVTAKPVEAKPVVQRKVMGGPGRGPAVAKVADASPDWEEF
jgi:methyl-accepting chemotaxis protein